MNKIKIIGVVIAFFALCFKSDFLYPQSFSSETNDLMAEVNLRSISAAIISYAEANNGKFPTDFLSDIINVNPPYLSQDYANMEKNGYKYSVEFYPDGYKIIATPIACSQTGTKVLVLEAKGEEVNKIIQGKRAPADLEIKKSNCE